MAVTSLGKNEFHFFFLKKNSRFIENIKDYDSKGMHLECDNRLLKTSSKPMKMSNIIFYYFFFIYLDPNFIFYFTLLMKLKYH